MTVTVPAIQAAVCAHFNIPPMAMQSPRRAREWARPRQIAMYLACELTPRSLPEIGRSFSRDHTTVIHAHRTIANLAARDEAIHMAVDIIWQSLGTPMPNPWSKRPVTAPA